MPKVKESRCSNEYSKLEKRILSLFILCGYLIKIHTRNLQPATCNSQLGTRN